jgi:hypothetical protein
VHHPRRDGEDRRCHLWNEPAIRKHGEVAGGIRHHHGPAWRRHPRRGTTQDHLGNFRRLERRVDGAPDLDERIAPFDTTAQRTLKDAEPCGQIETGRRQRRFGRATHFGSAFCGGADGLIQRHWHPGGLDWLKTSAKWFYPL